jgi:hypothetical protein
MQRLNEAVRKVVFRNDPSSMDKPAVQAGLEQTEEKFCGKLQIQQRTGFISAIVPRGTS